MYDISGHIYLQRLYREIIRMASYEDQLDISYIRQRIGEYLYTLQEFYSNTNWVEIQSEANPYTIFIYKYLGKTLQSKAKHHL